MFKSKLYPFLLLSLSFLVAVLLYLPAINGYFFQDDWFTLKISNAENINSFLGFFVPRSDVIYYRPLGMQIPFFLLSSLFGINPIPFKIFIVLIHLLHA